MLKISACTLRAPPDLRLRTLSPCTVISLLSFSTCSGDAVGFGESVPFIAADGLTLSPLSFFLLSLFFSLFLWPPVSF